MNMKPAFTIILLLLTCAFRLSAQQNTLDYYLSHAINNSPLIKDLQNQVLSFSIDSQIVRAGLRPQVTGNSNNMYAPTIKGYGYDPAITNVAQVSALVSVNKTFLSNKSLQAQLATSGIQARTASNNIRITQQDLRKNITDQYIVAYGEQLQLQSNREIGELLRREDTLLKTLTQNSVYRQTDYLSFLVTVQQQELSTAELEIQYEYDVATLNYLAGVNDTALIALADPQLRLVSIPDLYSSVFYRQFVFDSLKLRNDRALIDINY